MAFKDCRYGVGAEVGQVGAEGEIGAFEFRSRVFAKIENLDFLDEILETNERRRSATRRANGYATAEMNTASHTHPGDELGFVEWLKARQAHPARDASIVRLGIGDDMAIVAIGPGEVLLSSDMLLDGVHFDSKSQVLSRIGRKAIACSLSDCAAMAVRPVAVTVSIAWPLDRPMLDARELFTGMADLAAEFNVAIVGGDTTSWSHPLAIDVNVTASPYPGIVPVTRSGAKVGDTLYVTGPLGGSLLGRHLDFTPCVKEAHAIAGHFGNRLHAMIDITDGLSLDLWRMCQASDVGATVEATLLDAVISDAARQASSGDDRTPVEHALHDGEDFELLLAIEGEAPDSPVPLFRLGQVTAEGLCLRSSDGHVNTIEPRGYIHGR